MENKFSIKAVFFIGIGGIGMSALARYFNSAKIFTAGYDKIKSELTKKLEEDGILVHYHDEIKNIPNCFFEFQRSEILIVYTPAIPIYNKELNYFKQNNYTLKKRAEVLGIICNKTKTIAVSGTHGKTTVSTIISHIFKTVGANANAFLGGISKNLKSNLWLQENPEKAEFSIVEADEFDRSFLHLFPEIAVVTAIDADHLDIYGTKEQLETTFQQFVNQINKGGTLIIKENITDEAFQKPKNTLTYGTSKFADIKLCNLKAEKHSTRFDYKFHEGEFLDVLFSAPGKINAENATAAIAVAWQAGISEVFIREALASYQGVQRRFDYVISNNEKAIIDDYAHHPAELKAIIESVRHIYPDKEIAGIFQPHLFTRTRDFADEFSQSLDLLDKAYLLPIYPAREKPIEGVNSNLLLSKMKIENKEIIYNFDLKFAEKILQSDIILVLGAGDMLTIRKMLKKCFKKHYLY